MPQRIYAFVVIGFLCHSMSVHATCMPEPDTGYIQPLRHMLQFELFLFSRSNSLQIEHHTPSRTIQYSPNAPVQMGIGISHYWLSLSAALWLPANTNARPYRGDTRFFGLKAGINSHRFWGGAYFERYSGYYISNPGSVMPEWNNRMATFPLRTDLQTRAWLGNVIYNFKPERFSHNALIDLRDRQLRSAGTWLLGAGILSLRARADSTLAPSAESQAYPRGAQIKALDNQRLILSGGYAHTFVLKKKWYLSALIMPSISFFYGSHTLHMDSLVRIPLSTGGGLDAMLTLGYNSRRSLWGIRVDARTFSGNKAEGVFYTATHSQIRLLYGRRFDVSERIRSKVQAPMEWLKRLF